MLALVDGGLVGAFAALFGGALVGDLTGAFQLVFPPLGLDPGAFFPVEEDFFKAEF